MLNQCPLVLEGVTLAEMIQFVVEVLVDLAAGTILYEKAAEDTESSHPHNLPIRVVSGMISIVRSQCIYQFL